MVARTGASRVCGSCRPLLAELTGAGSAATAERWQIGLQAAASVAGVLALLIAAGAPTPPAASLRESGAWDVLYRVPWWRQATGFGVLALALLALAGYSARKRWPRLRRGSLTGWRMAHATLGFLALVVLVAHTGLRLGSGFNRILMVAFLAAATLGSVNAWAIDHRHARLVFWLHVAAVWPLPALVAVHVLSSYFF